MTLTPVDPEWPEFETFLKMESPDNVSGIMSTTKNLKGFWGTYSVFIVVIIVVVYCLSFVVVSNELSVKISCFIFYCSRLEIGKSWHSSYFILNK